MAKKLLASAAVTGSDACETTALVPVGGDGGRDDDVDGEIYTEGCSEQAPCPRCDRPRSSDNSIKSDKWPGDTLPFVGGICVPCVNLGQKTCRGRSVPDVTNEINSNAGNKKMWTSSMLKYEADLAEALVRGGRAPKGRDYGVNFHSVGSYRSCAKTFHKDMGWFAPEAIWLPVALKLGTVKDENDKSYKKYLENCEDEQGGCIKGMYVDDNRPYGPGCIQVGVRYERGVRQNDEIANNSQGHNLMTLNNAFDKARGKLGVSRAEAKTPKGLPDIGIRKVVVTKKQVPDKEKSQLAIEDGDAAENADEADQIDASDSDGSVEYLDQSKPKPRGGGGKGKGLGKGPGKGQKGRKGPVQGVEFPLQDDIKESKKTRRQVEREDKRLREAATKQYEVLGKYEAVITDANRTLTLASSHAASTNVKHAMIAKQLLAMNKIDTEANNIAMAGEHTGVSVACPDRGDMDAASLKLECDKAVNDLATANRQMDACRVLWEVAFPQDKKKKRKVLGTLYADLDINAIQSAVSSAQLTGWKVPIEVRLIISFSKLRDAFESRNWAKCKAEFCTLSSRHGGGSKFGILQAAEGEELHSAQNSLLWMFAEELLCAHSSNVSITFAFLQEMVNTGVPFEKSAAELLYWNEHDNERNKSSYTRLHEAWDYFTFKQTGEAPQDTSLASGLAQQSKLWIKILGTPVGTQLTKKMGIRLMRMENDQSYAPQLSPLKDRVTQLQQRSTTLTAGGPLQELESYVDELAKIRKEEIEITTNASDSFLGSHSGDLDAIKAGLTQCSTPVINVQATSYWSKMAIMMKSVTADGHADQSYEQADLDIMYTSIKILKVKGLDQALGIKSPLLTSVTKRFSGMKEFLDEMHKLWTAGVDIQTSYLEGAVQHMFDIKNQREDSPLTLHGMSEEVRKSVTDALCACGECIKTACIHQLLCKLNDPMCIKVIKGTPIDLFADADFNEIRSVPMQNRSVVTDIIRRGCRVAYALGADDAIILGETAIHKGTTPGDITITFNDAQCVFQLCYAFEAAHAANTASEHLASITSLTASGARDTFMNAVSLCSTWKKLAEAPYPTDGLLDQRAIVANAAHAKIFTGVMNTITTHMENTIKEIDAVLPSGSLGDALQLIMEATATSTDWSAIDSEVLGATQSPTSKTIFRSWKKIDWFSKCLEEMGPLIMAQMDAGEQLVRKFHTIWQEGTLTARTCVLNNTCLNTLLSGEDGAGAREFCLKKAAAFNAAIHPMILSRLGVDDAASTQHAPDNADACTHASTRVKDELQEQTTTRQLPAMENNDGITSQQQQLQEEEPSVTSDKQNASGTSNDQNQDAAKDSGTTKRRPLPATFAKVSVQPKPPLESGDADAAHAGGDEDKVEDDSEVHEAEPPATLPGQPEEVAEAMAMAAPTLVEESVPAVATAPVQAKPPAKVQTSLAGSFLNGAALEAANTFAQAPWKKPMPGCGAGAAPAGEVTARRVPKGSSILKRAAEEPDLETATASKRGRTADEELEEGAVAEAAVEAPAGRGRGRGRPKAATKAAAKAAAPKPAAKAVLKATKAVTKAPVAPKPARGGGRAAGTRKAAGAAVATGEAGA